MVGPRHNSHDMEVSTAFVACHTWNVLVFMWSAAELLPVTRLSLLYGIYSEWTVLRIARRRLNCDPNLSQLLLGCVYSIFSPSIYVQMPPLPRLCLLLLLTEE
jgi:hypothetical protein